jgi:very-short-patch-repair endonuclease
MTEPERRLWFGYLRNFKHRVLRQRQIDHYIVDFYCPDLRLVIEIDGETHFTDEGKEYDEERTKVLEGYELHVMRFTNTDVMANLQGICSKIDRFTCNQK